MTTNETHPNDTIQTQSIQRQDCLGCRVVGTGALGAVGLYALNQSRAHQPGSRFGKAVVAGIGVCELNIQFIPFFLFPSLSLNVFHLSM